MSVSTGVQLRLNRELIRDTWGTRHNVHDIVLFNFFHKHIWQLKAFPLHFHDIYYRNMSKSLQM
jgi:hypothetical protein